MSWNDNDQSSNESKNKPPVLVNRDDGAAAWLNTDKNDNVYVSVKLPLGLGTLNLFPRTDPDNDDYRNRESFNKLKEHIDKQA